MDDWNYMMDGRDYPFDDEDYPLDDREYTANEMLMDQWKNSACLGYAIAALENLGYEPDKISEAVSELTDLFDWLSVDQADELYRDSQYSENLYMD